MVTVSVLFYAECRWGKRAFLAYEAAELLAKTIQLSVQKIEQNNLIIVTL